MRWKTAIFWLSVILFVFLYCAIKNFAFIPQGDVLLYKLTDGKPIIVENESYVFQSEGTIITFQNTKTPVDTGIQKVVSVKDTGKGWIEKYDEYTSEELQTLKKRIVEDVIPEKDCLVITRKPSYFDESLYVDDSYSNIWNLWENEAGYLIRKHDISLQSHVLNNGKMVYLVVDNGKPTRKMIDKIEKERNNIIIQGCFDSI